MPKRKIYQQNQLNFLTLTVVGWIDIFSRATHRDLIIKSLEYCQKNKGLAVHAYVIMSNHIHLVSRAKKENNRGLSHILCDFKKFTSRAIIDAVKHQPESRRDWLLYMFEHHAKFNSNNPKHQFWMQKNHPTALWLPTVIQQKVNYIHANPVKAKIVKKASHYLYSSAINYETNNEQGLLEVELLQEMFLL